MPAPRDLELLVSQMTLEEKASLTAGADTNPSWYHNLVANPQATIEVGTETIPVVATVAEGDERNRLYDAQAALMPNFAEYAEKTSRQIPVFILTPA